MRRNEVHAHTRAHRVKHCAVIIISVIVLIATLIVIGGVLIWRYPGVESARAPVEEADAAAYISFVLPDTVVQKVNAAAQKTPLPPRVPPVAYNPPKQCPAGAVAAPGVKKSGACGSASLSVIDNGACPTTVGSMTPVCTNEYNWSVTVQQTAPADIPNIPICAADTTTSAGAPRLTFTINHTRQLKNSLLYGSGSLVVVNKGTCATHLTSLLLVLEHQADLVGTIPSRIAVIGVESAAVNNGCAASSQPSDTAYVCATASGLACNTPVGYSPRGLNTLSLDSTLIAPGEGCSQAVTFPIDFAFALSEANKTFMAASPTGYRIGVLATFDGCCDTSRATCGIDVDCNGVVDNVVTTRFASPSFSIDMNACDSRCACAPIRNTIRPAFAGAGLGACAMATDTYHGLNGTVCETGVFSAALTGPTAGFCCRISDGGYQSCNPYSVRVTDIIAPAPTERMACTGYDGSELLTYTDNRVFSHLTCECVPRVCPATIAAGSACQLASGCSNGIVDCSSACESPGNVCINGACMAVIPPSPAAIVTCESYACIPGDASSDAQMTPTLSCTARPCAAACQACAGDGTCLPVANCV